MAYQIDRYDNSLLTTVEDGTIDQTTDLKFIGKNYAGYGEIQNENFLYLLENFSGANPPPRAISGQIWFDSASKKLKFYDGAKFRTTGGAEVSTSQPSGLTVGDFWWDTANNQLYAYNGTGWVLIGPQNVGSGVTQMVSQSVRDDQGVNRSVIAAYIDDEVIYVISGTEFTIDSSDSENAIDGFDRVKKGLTLKNTTNATNGITQNNFNFWGTASNSLRLNGIPAADYVTKAEASFLTAQTSVSFNDNGLTIGDSNDLRIEISDDDEGVITNEVGETIKFRTKDAGTGNIVHSITINSTGMMPAADSQFNIGSSTLKWANIHANSFVGEATRATTLKTGSEYREASTNASNNTVAVRTATGDIAANLFIGTATKARYADLAEKYTTDKEYPVGTVMSVCEHGDHETEAASAGSIAIGVISAEPAYLMNSECNGQAIGLKGRVPVRVIGAVKKGQAVYVHGEGLACVEHTGACLVGVALESSDNEGEKLIECVLKV